MNQVSVEVINMILEAYKKGLSEGGESRTAKETTSSESEKEESDRQPLPENKETPRRNHERWTKYEDDFIIEKLGNMDLADIAKGIGRTEKAIENRTYYLKAAGKIEPDKRVKKTKRHSSWSHEDDMVLKSSIVRKGGHLSLPEGKALSAILKRTPEAIRTRSYILVRNLGMNKILAEVVGNDYSVNQK